MKLPAPILFFGLSGQLSAAPLAALMHAGAVGVDGDLGSAFREAVGTDGLAEDQPPAHEAGMLAGSDYVAFDSCQEHGQGARAV